jgi:excisionase family DNA binding protein
MLRLMEHLMTLSQAADYLQLSTKTVERAIKEDQLPASKVRGRWRIHPVDLAAFVEERKKKANR